MRKVLFVGDAVVATGFARSTHHLLEAVRQTWDVTVLGLNYAGDPHEYPYPIFPANAGGDGLGYGRVGQLAKALEIDLIVVQCDPWHVEGYVESVRSRGVTAPIVGILAVDGKNCQAKSLNGLAMTIFWTKFAEQEARAGGYLGPSAVVPLGVDLALYQPIDRKIARSTLQIDKGVGKSTITMDSFIVGTVGRNQQRKRLDLLSEYFCDWVESRHITDAYLLVQAAPTGECEYDVEQYFKYRGLRERLAIVTPNIGQGIPERFMRCVYGIFDAYVSTTQGEGWGLPAMEAMACGVPCVLPDWSAYGEWAKYAALLVPCTSHAWTQGRINVIGGIADKALFIDALDRVYRSAPLRRTMILNGLALAKQPEYRWEAIGEAVTRALDTVVPVPLEVDDSERVSA